MRRTNDSLRSLHISDPIPPGHQKQEAEAWDGHGLRNCLPTMPHMCGGLHAQHSQVVLTGPHRAESSTKRCGADTLAPWRDTMFLGWAGRELGEAYDCHLVDPRNVHSGVAQQVV